MENGERLPLHRPWSDLPELILHAIVVKLPGPADFFAFAGVCRTWRSSSVPCADEFISSLSPLFCCTSLIPISNNPSTYHSTDLFLHSIRDDDAVYKFPFSFASTGLLFIGQSNGHLIALDRRAKVIPIIINPFTGARIVFPAIVLPFHYAILTTSNAADPGCRLVLVDETENLLLHCLVSGGEWQVLRFRRKGLTDVIAYKDRLYLVQRHEKVFEYDFGADLFHVVAIGAPFGGRLMESDDGDLMMLRTGPPPLECWRVMPAPQGHVFDPDYCLKRVFPWPAGRTLMFKWQRSDFMGSPWIGRMPRRKKVVDVDPQSGFWSNFLKRSPPFCNVVCVAVDACGRATLATHVPRT